MSHTYPPPQELYEDPSEPEKEGCFYGCGQLIGMFIFLVGVLMLIGTL